MQAGPNSVHNADYSINAVFRVLKYLLAYLFVALLWAARLLPGYATILPMIAPSYLYRNSRSAELLELFLVSAVTCVLLVRFYLHLAGYPELGSNNLHVAHMLPGGMLMLGALVLMMAFIGSQVQRLAAVLGGIGFGLFIDELGKFITHDNNYFFQPTAAMLYIIFMLLFVSFRSLTKRQAHLTQPEYLLNAISLLEEAVINDLDAVELRRARAYLHRADPNHPLVKHLQHVLNQIRPQTTAQRPRLQRWRHQVAKRYENVIQTKWAIRTIDTVFALKAGIFLTAALVELTRFDLIALQQDIGFVSTLHFLSSLVSTLFVIAGITVIRSSRLKAYELFTKSLLIDIFVTQFFSFYSNQFAALPAFVLNVTLYIGVRFLIQQERRVVHRS